MAIRLLLTIFTIAVFISLLKYFLRSQLTTHNSHNKYLRSITCEKYEWQGASPLINPGESIVHIKENCSPSTPGGLAGHWDTIGDWNWDCWEESFLSILRLDQGLPGNQQILPTINIELNFSYNHWFTWDILCLFSIHKTKHDIWLFAI